VRTTKSITEERRRRRRRRRTMETLWYEVSPYIYSAGGALWLAHADSNLGVISGLLLLASAVTVLRLRWTHRRGRAAPRAHTALRANTARIRHHQRQR
jgi:hypothetical protein